MGSTGLFGHGARGTLRSALPSQARHTFTYTLTRTVAAVRSKWPTANTISRDHTATAANISRSYAYYMSATDTHTHTPHTHTHTTHTHHTPHYMHTKCTPNAHQMHTTPLHAPQYNSTLTRHGAAAGGWAAPRRQRNPVPVPVSTVQEYRRLDGSQGRAGHARKISPKP